MFWFVILTLKVLNSQDFTLMAFKILHVVKFLFIINHLYARLIAK